jgi:hypothetical protein
MPYRRTHWEGCQAVHSECGGDVPFQQQNLFDPAPDPIDAARDDFPLIQPNSISNITMRFKHVGQGELPPLPFEDEDDQC